MASTKPFKGGELVFIPRSPPTSSAEAPKLRPLLLPRRLTGEIITESMIAKSSASSSASARARRNSIKSVMTPADNDSSATESETDSEELRSASRKVAPSQHLVLEFFSPDCASLVGTPSVDPIPRSIVQRRIESNAARSRSETFKFPVPPSALSIAPLPQQRRVPSGRVHRAGRTASGRSLVGALADEKVAHQNGRRGWEAYPPALWALASPRLEGSQGWSPNTSECGSPKQELEVTLLPLGDYEAITAPLSHTKSSAANEKKIGEVEERWDFDSSSQGTDSEESETGVRGLISRHRGTSLPSYRQAKSLPSYHDVKATGSPGESSSSASSEACDTDADEFDVDAQKLARLHASLQLLDQGAEIPLSFQEEEKDYTTVAEQMAYLCGLGYRYSKRSISGTVMRNVTPSELATSEYDGEAAEIGSSWSSAQNSSRLESIEGFVDEKGLPMARLRSFSPSTVAVSNGTSCRSSPILSGSLAAVTSPSLSDSSPIPDVPSPLGPNEIDIYSLCARPLEAMSPPLTNSAHDGSTESHESERDHHHHHLAEFSYLVDDSIFDIVTPPSETSDLPTTNPFSPALNTPELGLLKTPAPMDCFPSPSALSGFKPFGNGEAIRQQQVAASSSLSPLSRFEALTSSNSCPAFALFSADEDSSKSNGEPFSVLSRPRPCKRLPSSFFGTTALETEKVRSVAMERSKSGSASKSGGGKRTCSLEVRQGAPSPPSSQPIIPARKSSIDLQRSYALAKEDVQHHHHHIKNRIDVVNSAVEVAARTEVPSNRSSAGENSPSAFWDETKSTLIANVPGRKSIHFEPTPQPIRRETTPRSPSKKNGIETPRTNGGRSVSSGGGALSFIRSKFNSSPNTTPTTLGSSAMTTSDSNLSSTSSSSVKVSSSGERRRISFSTSTSSSIMTRQSSSSTSDSTTSSSTPHNRSRTTTGPLILKGKALVDIKKSCKSKADFIRSATLEAARREREILNQSCGNGDDVRGRVMTSQPGPGPVRIVEPATTTKQQRRGRRDEGQSWSSSEEEPDSQGSYYLPSSTSLPTLYVARTPSQRRAGRTGVPETESDQHYYSSHVSNSTRNDPQAAVVNPTLRKVKKTKNQTSNQSQQDQDTYSLASGLISSDDEVRPSQARKVNKLRSRRKSSVVALLNQASTNPSSSTLSIPPPPRGVLIVKEEVMITL
ncbi:hypothetical protein IE53DRAFT_367902 [Violaceomyces palustris]|uniref:Uncharacterized protein n=1 Tax=Violaceomyces palustris TaxID=1673888 RepID=A0ACD0P0T0_9BASI|nr:hypothetical protein IE53DRAFT_367902 [Violaceomyces palustris]